jgi:cytochrome c553
MASFPKLAGHDAEYLLERLQQYHAGEKVGPGSALMIPVAQDLSEEDMANVAAYIASTFE